MDITLLLADPKILHVDTIAVTPVGVQISAHTVASQTPCPRCQQGAGRMHSRYVRTVSDVPWQGQTVRWHICVRRFFCDHPSCPQRIFCERLPTVVKRKARRTVRLRTALEVMGFAMGGESGARVASQLGMPTSPDTLLRTIRQAPPPICATPRVLSVDDWATRKGQRYGTILVDLETRHPIELLPDREAATLATWLKKHPGVEIISRDRAGAYADGARQGAPDATQVADRWHLVSNLHAVLEQVLNQQHRVIREAVATLNAQADPVPAPPAPVEKPIKEVMASGRYCPPSHPPHLRSQHFHDRRRARYEQVKALQQQGWSINEIRKHLGWSYAQVQRFFEADTYPLMSRGRYKSVMDQVEAYLRQRWPATQNARHLYHEVQQHGYRGSEVTLRRYVHRWRVARPSLPPRAPSTMRVPTPRATMWLLMRAPTKLGPQDRAVVAEVLKNSDPIQQAVTLVQSFRRLLHRRDEAGLTGWMEQAATCGLKAFANFVTSLRRDEEAVHAAFSSPWSNGQVEGHINRLKTVKRQMYGRANFDLLRARVLHAA